MKFMNIASLALAASTANAFRDETQKKSDHRRLEEEMVCTLNNEAVRIDGITNAEEMYLGLEAFPGGWRRAEGLFEITLDQPPFGTKENPVKNYGWCIDYDRPIDSGYYHFDVFTAYDPEIHTTAVDYPEYFPNLVWMINNVNVNDMWPRSSTCKGGKVRWRELQGAVWWLIDDNQGQGSWYEDIRVDCISQEIAQMAKEMGNDYQIDCMDPNEQIPIVYVSDRDDEFIEHQVIMSETNVHTVQGLCDCRKVTDAPTDSPTVSPTASPTAPATSAAEPEERSFNAPPKETPFSKMNTKCADFGYEYGLKFDNGCEELEMPFNDVTDVTGSKTCDTPGSVKIECDADLVDATITSDIPFNVIVKGGNQGGTLYEGQQGTVTLNNGGDKRQAISHIEFCFTCGESPAPEPASPTPAPPAPSPASSSGDPHFKTWTGEKFDYHGECDLVLVDNPTFNNGQGLRVHIRTTRVKYFSYIEKVAVQIGDDILEFDNDVENFLINGEQVEPNHKHHKTHLAGFVVRRDPKALSIRLHDNGSQDRHAGMVAKIDLHTRKNGFPAVIMDGGKTDIFKGSLGLLGEWETGKKLARDGQTEMIATIDDSTDFALEWQVRDTDPMLFKDARFPQYPNTCIPPMERVGRIGETAARVEAEAACAHWEEDMDDCIFDVMATRDVLVAQEGHIIHVQ